MLEECGMDSRAFIYDIIYALAARDGREAALFGGCASLAHDAFCASVTGEPFPEVWFEIPLLGDPWFDVHILTSREAMDDSTEPPTGCGQKAQDAFRWFRTSHNTRQLALSWDIGTSGAKEPAIQVLLYEPDADASCAFLESVGRADAQEAYRTFVERIPQDWFACYSGVFPTRTTPFLRVECVTSYELRDAYAADANLLRAHLEQCGLPFASDASCDIVPVCQHLASLPYQLEFQFNIDKDGNPTDVFSPSVRFALSHGTSNQECFDVNGPIAELMSFLESKGLADDRWRLLADTAFAQSIKKDGGAMGTLYCAPIFIKLRWSQGKLLDTKAYLIAGIE